MRYLLPLLLFVASPTLASKQLCDLIDYELEQAVASGYITEQERTDIYLRCLALDD